MVYVYDVKKTPKVLMDGEFDCNDTFYVMVRIGFSLIKCYSGLDSS